MGIRRNSYTSRVWKGKINIDKMREQSFLGLFFCSVCYGSEIAGMMIYGMSASGRNFGNADAWKGDTLFEKIKEANENRD